MCEQEEVVKNLLFIASMLCFFQFLVIVLNLCISVNLLSSLVQRQSTNNRIRSLLTLLFSLLILLIVYMALNAGRIQCNGGEMYERVVLPAELGVSKRILVIYTSTLFISMALLIGSFIYY